MSRGMSFEGTVYIGKELGSNAYYDVGESDKFEILAPSVTMVKLLSKKSAQWGQTVDSIESSESQELAITLQTWSRENLLSAFLGSDTTVTVTAGSVADVNYNAVLGYQVKLAHSNISSVVVADDGAVQTFVVGDDYTVDLDRGFITAIDGGAIEEGELLEVSYDYAATSGFDIAASVRSSIVVPVRFEGRSRSDTSINVIIEAPEVTLYPTSGFDFLSGEFVPVELTGSMRTPTGWTSPFVYSERS